MSDGKVAEFIDSRIGLCWCFSRSGPPRRRAHALRVFREVAAFASERGKDQRALVIPSRSHLRAVTPTHEAAASGGGAEDRRSLNNCSRRGGRRTVAELIESGLMMAPVKWSNTSAGSLWSAGGERPAGLTLGAARWALRCFSGKQGATTMVGSGDQAPNFSGTLADGREFRLRDFRGRRHVIVYFFAKDFTPG